METFSGTQLRLFIGMPGEASSGGRRAEAGEGGSSLFAGDSGQRTTIATGNGTNSGTGEAGRSTRGFSIERVVIVAAIGGSLGGVTPGTGDGSGGGGGRGNRSCRNNGGSGGS